MQHTLFARWTRRWAVTPLNQGHWKGFCNSRSISPFYFKSSNPQLGCNAWAWWTHEPPHLPSTNLASQAPTLKILLLSSVEPGKGIACANISCHQSSQCKLIALIFEIYILSSWSGLRKSLGPQEDSGKGRSQNLRGIKLVHRLLSCEQTPNHLLHTVYKESLGKKNSKPLQDRPCRPQKYSG